MPFFLDNNVLIGYIFETDNWNSKSLKVDDLQSFTKNFYSKDVIIGLLNLNLSHDKSTIINGLRTLLRDTESRCLTNFQTLDNLITFYKRDKSYKEIYHVFEIDGLAQIDLIDVEIILDAHHIGLQVGELFFITGDYLHIVPRRDIIKNNTSLKDVIGLGEFYPGRTDKQ